MNEQDQRVRDYYKNLSLPQERLELLLKIEPAKESVKQADNKPHNTAAPTASRWTSLREPLSLFNPVHWQWHHWLPAGLASALFLLVSLWVHDSSNDSERLQRTVREVAMNHTTRLEPEYHGETPAMLDNSMQQLPFALVLPKSVDDAYELIGSRYCSIAGVLAAHVRLRNRGSGKPMSLFVTSNSVELKHIGSQQTIHEGVDVEFWREGGLFFARAQRS